MTLFAKQDTPNVPVYAITANGEDVGTITDFPNEGVAYTIRVLGLEVTNYTATTIHGALEAARRDYAALLDGTHYCYEIDPYADEDIEDEDGEIAAMRAAEDRAERGADLDDVPYWDR